MKLFLKNVCLIFLFYNSNLFPSSYPEIVDYIGIGLNYKTNFNNNIYHNKHFNLTNSVIMNLEFNLFHYRIKNILYKLNFEYLKINKKYYEQNLDIRFNEIISNNFLYFSIGDYYEPFNLTIFRKYLGLRYNVFVGLSVNPNVKREFLSNNDFNKLVEANLVNKQWENLQINFKTGINIQLGYSHGFTTKYKIQGDNGFNEFTLESYKHIIFYYLGFNYEYTDRAYIYNNFNYGISIGLEYMIGK